MKRTVYAARLKNKEKLMQSSSGGAFTAISDVVLAVKGAILATCYNYETNDLEFRLIKTATERNLARGSKYIQAKPTTAFAEAYNWLEENPDKQLLFIGVGCQADGFRKFSEIKGIRDRVLIVDIVCHGTPSPQIWKDYLANKKIDYVTFKDKRNGWKNPTAFIVYRGKEKLIREYVKIFYNQCALRPSCYKCKYATINRNVDITIGDFWGIEKAIPTFYSKEGASLIIIHSTKGMNAWKEASKSMDWVESDVESCLQPNLVAPTKKSDNRDVFWEEYQKKGIQFIVKKYGGRVSMHKRLIKKIKRCIKRILSLRERG